MAIMMTEESIRLKEVMANDAFDKLQESLTVLRALLSSCDMIVPALWEIQFRGNQDTAETAPEETPITEQQELPEAIEIKEASAQRRVIIDALTGIFLSGNQNPKETYRAPGVVGLPANVIKQLMLVSNHKLAFYEAMMAIKTPRERQKAMKRRTGLSVLQAYRIPLIFDRLLHVAFNWETAPSIKPVTAGEIRTQIQDRIGQYTSEKERSAIELNLKQLEGIPSDELLAIIRTGKPHIRASFQVEKRTRYKQTQAPIPIVYNLSNSEPAVKGISISNYETTARSRREPEPLIEALNLYRYQEPYRRRQSQKPDSGSNKHKLRTGKIID